MTILRSVTIRQNRARNVVSARATRRLISAACHSERFLALISLSAYTWPFYGLSIGAPYQAFTLAGNSLYMGKFLALPAMPALPAFIASTPTLAASLAAEYLQAPAAVPTDRELAILRGWIRAEFQRIPAMVRFEGADIPLPEMLQRWERSGVLFISVERISHPFLTDTENALFRAVHDWHHIAIGADSTLNGEMLAFEHACSTAPSEIHWMLRSEILLQAAACIATGEFQPQKLVR